MLEKDPWFGSVLLAMRCVRFTEKGEDPFAGLGRGNLWGWVEANRGKIHARSIYQPLQSRIKDLPDPSPIKPEKEKKK